MALSTSALTKLIKDKLTAAQSTITTKVPNMVERDGNIVQDGEKTMATSKAPLTEEVITFISGPIAEAVIEHIKAALEIDLSAGVPIIPQILPGSVSTGAGVAAIPTPAAIPLQPLSGVIKSPSIS